MDKIEKLFRKMPEKDRKRIGHVIQKILARDFAGIKCKKLKDRQSIFRTRVGDYRIIFYDDGRNIEIKGLRIRNKSTYKNL